MRLVFWVTALAVLSITWAKNATSKTKPKRQLESIRTPHNIQYSLVLPHSRVTHFRALTSDRRISNAALKGGKLPPYAVQMEPVVQYSQKDPLYDPNLDNTDDSVINRNDIFAQPKILNIRDQAAEGTYGPPYGSLPTAPLYSHEPPAHYYEAPEPIIEIIIKESNESLPAPPPPPVQKKKKEPVHVFYVKYSKDPHHKDKVIYEKPVPAITPPTNEEDEHHHEDYVTVTPEPLYALQPTTTLRAIIKPESEVYHSDGSVRITFGNEGAHYSQNHDRQSHSEDHEETAPRPAIAYPQQAPTHPPLERSASAKPHSQEPAPRPSPHPSSQTYRSASQHAQSRIQYQPTYLANEQQLPRQGPSVAPFRGQSHITRHPFGPSQSQSPFSSGLPGPTQFVNIGPTVAAQSGPPFAHSFPRPSDGPSFHQRPSNLPQFSSRFNGPPRNGPPSFHSGPQRPFHQPQPQSQIQPQAFFDEPKYLQENYHTITTEDVEPPKEQLLPSRQQQKFNVVPRPSPSSPPAQFQDRPQFIPLNQQLPHQRPHQQFTDSAPNKPSFAPSRPNFLHLKPSPPQIDDNRPNFHQHLPLQQQQFSFHQGPQTLSRPSPPVPQQQNFLNPSPSPIPQTQFLPQPSSPTLFNFHSQPSQSPDHEIRIQENPVERPQFQQPHGPSERPQYHQHHGPSERPNFQQHQGPSERPNYNNNPSERPQLSNFQDQSNFQHQQNVGQFVPQGGELVAAIPKYEQHITVNGPTAQPDYNGLSQHSAAPTQATPQYQPQQTNPQPTPSQPPRQYFDDEQEQVRLQLAQNVQKQQEEIQRLQNQILYAQQQHQQSQAAKQQQQQLQQQHEQQQQQKQQQQQLQQQHEQHQQQKQQQQQLQQQHEQHQQQKQQQQQQQQELYRQYEDARNYYQQQSLSTSPKPQNNQDRSRPSLSPHYYQSTSRTVEIKPTTQKYVSSTVNSISSTPTTKKEEKKKKPSIQLPDEVPDDLRQQLLSSGILDNADISILDYDKVGDTPLESLPPDQLANFFSAGGGHQIASSEHRPIIVTPEGDQIQSRIDDEDDDQELSASENVPSYVAPPSHKQAVEMKVVHFDPKTAQGQNIAKDYVKDDATRLDPVTLNDKKYNRYLPLKVSGNQFPLPDILKGRKITSVVVLAPVETEALNGDHNRAERAASNSLKGIRFIAGDSLQDLLKKPTKDNFEKWLEMEKKTAADLQSVVLLVTGNEDESSADREIYMYDITTGNVNKLSGDLSNAFVEAAENNSLSRDIEKLAIEGEGVPEDFNKDPEDRAVEASENVPLLVDLSGLTLDQETSNQVSISSGYSKTKRGRSFRGH